MLLGAWFLHSVRLAAALGVAIVAMQAPAVTREYQAALLQLVRSVGEDIAQRKASARRFYGIPILSEELFILAFRDESLSDRSDDAVSERRYIVNLIRPLVFPFLKDCVRIGQLALRESIGLAVLRDSRVMAELELAREQIVPGNGSIVLWNLA